MTNEDYIEMYHRWKNSKKYTQLQQKLNKQKMMHIHKDNEELDNMLNRQFEYYTSNIYINEEYSSLDDLINSYRTHIINLTINLKYREVTEEFEICGKILKLIELKIECLETLAFEYFTPTEYEIGEIDTLQQLTMDIISNNWDSKNNKLKKI